MSGLGVTPTLPTSAKPGSAEKIAILAERVKNKMSLWHPDDTRINETDLPKSCPLFAMAG
jgi:hypothetical protein